MSREYKQLDDFRNWSMGKLKDFCGPSKIEDFEERVKNGLTIGEFKDVYNVNSSPENGMRIIYGSLTANRFLNYVIPFIAKIYWKRQYNSENIEEKRDIFKKYYLEEKSKCNSVSSNSLERSVEYFVELNRSIKECLNEKTWCSSGQENGDSVVNPLSSSGFDYATCNGSIKLTFLLNLNRAIDLILHFILKHLAKMLTANLDQLLIIIHHEDVFLTFDQNYGHRGLFCVNPKKYRRW